MSKHLFSLCMMLMLGSSGTRSAASVSPLKMKMKSALPCRPFRRKNFRFVLALSDSAYVYSTSGRSSSSPAAAPASALVPPSEMLERTSSARSVPTSFAPHRNHITRSVPTRTVLFQFVMVKAAIESCRWRASARCNPRCAFSAGRGLQRRVKKKKV